MFCKAGRSIKTSNLTDYDAAKRIWNCDETGFCTAIATKSVLAKRGSKNIHETLGGSGREYITVLGIRMWISFRENATTVHCLQG